MQLPPDGNVRLHLPVYHGEHCCSGILFTEQRIHFLPEWSFRLKVIKVNTVDHYRPQTKLREGNVFTPVCDSVHRGEGVSVYGDALDREPSDRDPPGQRPPGRDPPAQTPLHRDRLIEIPLDRDPPDRDHPEQRPPWTETPTQRPPTQTPGQRLI